ncbi:MAG TPA: zf-HC2 domain-containing protein, partial [Thermoanaerobaculia bacterium]|nr:zf-HC2 domain-containing protein [Thermoanaerobaculia bacterium]
MATCPEAETLAAYLDGELFPEERERLEEHLAGCATCSRLIAETALFAGGEVTGGTRATGPNVLPAVAAAAVVALATTLWLARAAGWEPWRTDSREPLVAATAEARPLVPRLTGGFHWAPPGETFRGGTTGPVAWRYYAAAESVRQAAVASPSAERLGALADAHLLVGDVDAALVTLARATAASPDDPRLQNDLAAAYLTRFERQGGADDLAAGLEAASGALAAAPGLREAAFNRALALEGLGLSGEAARAWQTYLDGEVDPGWASEARSHLRELQQRAATRVTADPRVALRAAAESGDGTLSGLVTQHRLAARRLVERELLPRWGEAVLVGDAAGAARALAQASALAQPYAAQTGDQRLTSEVNAAATARSAGARALARAYIDQAAGERQVDAFDYTAAKPELQRAAAAFGTGTLGARRATIELGICDLFESGPSEALVAAARGIARTSTGDLPSRGRALWLEGVVEAKRGNAAASLGRYLQALDIFERLGEADTVAWLHYLVGEAYALAGDSRSSWNHRAAALATVGSAEDVHRRFGVLFGSGGWSLLSGQAHVALAFFRELADAGYAVDPQERAQLHGWTARAALQLADAGAAREHIQRASQAALQLPASSLRRWIVADVAASRGAVAADPIQAVAAFTRALTIFRGLHVEHRVPGVLLERARANRQAGNSLAAEDDLREGIQALERQRVPDPTANLWLTRLDGADQLYDEMIALELERQRPAEAFFWAERARSRRLHLANPEAQPATTSLSELSARLDADSVVLFYVLLDKRAVLWRVDHSGARLVPIPASPAELRSWVDRLDADLSAGEWTALTRVAASSLYTALIEPADIGPRQSRLVVVPDKSLDALPFAALVEPRSGDFLIQSHVVEISPAAGFYLRARER